MSNKLEKVKYNISAIAKQNSFGLNECDFFRGERVTTYLNHVVDLCEGVISDNLELYELDSCNLGGFGKMFYSLPGAKDHLAAIFVSRKDTPKCKEGDIEIESVLGSILNRRLKSLVTLLEEIRTGERQKQGNLDIKQAVKFRGRYYTLLSRDIANRKLFEYLRNI